MKTNKFTLAEIMVTVAVIAVVAAIALPEVSKNRRTAVEQNKKANIKALKTAVLCYLMDSPQNQMSDINHFNVISPFLDAESRHIDHYTISGETVSINDGVISYVPIN